jgi:acyl-CoA synthetase (AMP-forming)/AMP-acid ligase II
VAALRRSALRLLPGHAVPDRFVLVDELPLTATAKPDRMALAAMASGEGGRASGG